jgi:hypothetical protein
VETPIVAAPGSSNRDDGDETGVMTVMDPGSGSRRPPAVEAGSLEPDRAASISTS